MTTSIALSTINIQVQQEAANTMNLMFINLKPDFQRDYEAWDDKLKARFIETILIGRAMNPIWTILNPWENSHEVLDGMHRVTTAVDFLNNRYAINAKHFTEITAVDEYDGKYFRDLKPDDQNRIRNYNFYFNHLDSSYKTDVNKLQDQYEILNRSSKTLNEYEFNKVLYNPFFDIIKSYKEGFKVFIRVPDKRGAIETGIINILVLSYDLPSSWNSINMLRERFYEEKLGKSEESVKMFLNTNANMIESRLVFLTKIIKALDNNKFFDENNYRTYNVPYMFIIGRIAHKFKDIALVNRHVESLMNNFNHEIIEEFVNKSTQNRNATFQKILNSKIEAIIDRHLLSEDPASSKRLFDKSMMEQKLAEQGNVCAICKTEKKKYEGDHIVPWSKGGSTTIDNLQMICEICHKAKTADQLKKNKF